MRTYFLRGLLACALVGLFATQFLATSVVAQTTTEASPEVLEPREVVPVEAGNANEVEVPEEEAPGLDSGDNAWMLTSSALVLFMTAPGLAMFYSGLVRKKNVLGVMMQCLFLMGLMTVVWSLWGYTLAFGGDDPYIGNLEFLFMENVQPAYDAELGEPVTPMHGTIPEYTFMLFQGMFFIITPALICGAFAERMKFSAMAVFSILWGTLVYCPLCHWVWDGGILAYGEPASLAGGALDFAGGTVVHISSGISALVCAIFVGKRLGYGHDDMRPHNLTYTTLGAAMLWVGWFGFNAGSACAADALASNAFAVTHFSAAAGAVAWAMMEWIQRGKPSVLGCASGAVAGLVCITPAAGFVLPMPALAMGAAAGIVCYYTCTVLKQQMGYDDSLDAFGVHGVGGTLGAVLTGVFATRNVMGGEPIGLYEGGGVSLLIGQVVAVLVTVAFSVAATAILLKLIDVLIGLRVTQESEIRGLDISEHGEEGYIFS
ncbi:ammonium transporter [Bremerella sp. JC817]|uniref:ammonium transporter n=1 Tax=Bremerella sp. JC817 TaxID=3231756 RepID=UPI00345754FE